MRIIIFVVIFTIVAAVAGILGYKAAEYRYQQNAEDVAALSDRIDQLSATVEDLEDRNNNLIGENQELREQLETELDTGDEEVSYATTELGRRLIAFDMPDPDLYFEYDKEFGEASVVARPAKFSDTVTAEGIQISFADSDLSIYVEPWQLNNLALAKIEEYETTTADGKQAQIVVLEGSDDQLVVNGILATQGEAPDAVKLLISREATNDNQQLAVDEVRDIMRSVEFDFASL